MRRILLVSVLLVLAAFLLIEFCGVSVCDGAYTLQVQVRSASGTPIEAVRCDACSDAHCGFDDPRELEKLVAAGAFKERSPSGGRWEVTAQPFRGAALPVSIRMTQRVSICLERDLGYSQFRALLVAIEYAGGKRLGKVVPIPDGRVAQSVTVTVP